MTYSTMADSTQYRGRKIDDRFLEMKLGNVEYKTKTFATLTKARAYAYKKVNLIKGANISCEVGSNAEMKGWVYRERSRTIWNDYNTGVEKILKADGTCGAVVGSAPWWE